MTLCRDRDGWVVSHMALDSLMLISYFERQRAATRVEFAAVTEKEGMVQGAGEGDP